MAMKTDWNLTPAEEKILERGVACGEFPDHEKVKKLLSREEIRETIRTMQKERADSLVIDDAWVLLRAVELYRRCAKEKPVSRWDSATKTYVDTDETTFDCQGALRALRFIADLLAQQPGAETPVFRLIDDVGDANDE